MAVSDSNQTSIQIRTLIKSFGQHRVLRGIDLAIQNGEFLALLGPNGAGKTTLIRIIATLGRPTSGQVLVNGQPADGDTRLVRQHLGLVSHQTFLYDDLTAEENLHFYGQMYRVPNLEERAHYLLDRVGLYERRRDRVRTYSRGMQQRLSIARAILHDPPILLLDEPDTGLDQQATHMLGELLAMFGTESRTVLMTTHQLGRALDLGSRVVVLAGGKICLDRPTAGLSSEALASQYAAVTQRRPARKRGWNA